MKTEADYGRDYAAQLVDDGLVSPGDLVNIEQMLGRSIYIPDGDYVAMRRSGITNPSALEYWTGYNAYMQKQAGK